MVLPAAAELPVEACKSWYIYDINWISRDFLPSSTVFGKMSSHINISCQEILFNKTLVVEGT